MPWGRGRSSGVATRSSILPAFTPRALCPQRACLENIASSITRFRLRAIHMKTQEISPKDLEGARRLAIAILAEPEKKDELNAAASQSLSGGTMVTVAHIVRLITEE